MEKSLLMELLPERPPGLPSQAIRGRGGSFSLNSWAQTCSGRKVQGPGRTERAAKAGQGSTVRMREEKGRQDPVTAERQGKDAVATAKQAIHSGAQGSALLPGALCEGSL